MSFAHDSLRGSWPSAVSWPGVGALMVACLSLSVATVLVCSAPEPSF